MKKTAMAVAIASVTAMAAQAGTVTSDGPDIVLKTKGGLEAKTADGKASFKIGGRIQLDYNSYDGVMNAVPGEDGSDLFFRRARLELEGHYSDWGYLMSYNLIESGSIDQLHTTYMGFGDLAELTFGQQKTSAWKTPAAPSGSPPWSARCPPMLSTPAITWAPSSTVPTI